MIPKGASRLGGVLDRARRRGETLLFDQKQATELSTDTSRANSIPNLFKLTACAKSETLILDRHLAKFANAPHAVPLSMDTLRPFGALFCRTSTSRLDGVLDRARRRGEAPIFDHQQAIITSSITNPSLNQALK